MRTKETSKRACRQRKTISRKEVYARCQALALLFVMVFSLANPVYAINDTSGQAPEDIEPSVVGSEEPVIEPETEIIEPETTGIEPEHLDTAPERPVAEPEIVPEEDKTLAAVPGASGAVNSKLEDRYTYIIYGYSTGTGRYCALSESGETIEVTASGAEVHSDTEDVKWTYDAKKKAFYNQAGKYLNTTGWYAPLTAGDKPQAFTTDSPYGGDVVTVLSTGDRAHLTFFNGQLVAGNYDAYQGIYFARTDDERKPEPPPEPSEPPAHPNTVDIQKYVQKLNEGDRYDLNLTVDGAYTKDGKNKADIIFVVDTTGSMMYAMDGTQDYSYERWNSILTATDYMTDLLGTKSTADIRYSMIFFSGGSYGVYEDAEVNQQWTKDTAVIMNALKQKTDGLGGGTNYEAACKELVDGPLVGEMRQDAERIGVFLSDGEPNMCYAEDGSSINDGGGEIAIAKAKERLQQLTEIDQFYCVGVGSDLYEQGKLEDLSSVLADKNIDTGYAHCNNTKEIERAFDKIIHSIVQMKYNHIRVVDDLSRYAQIVSDTTLRLTVTNNEGKPVGKAEGDLTTGATLHLEKTDINDPADLFLSYQADTKQLILTFPDTYILEDGWKYRLTATIQPTSIAYNEYAQQQGYPNEGDPETGETSTKQPGFYSNREANLHYTLNDMKESTMVYPKPVIQVSYQTGSRLPDTGGVGTMPVYMAGVMLLILFIFMEFVDRKKKYKKQSQ